MRDIKNRFYSALKAFGEASPAEMQASIDTVFAPDAEWRVSHPMNELAGNKAALEEVWMPLKNAMPDMERRDLIFMGGTYEGRTYLGAVGHYCGTFANDWLTIPATGKTMCLRYGEVYQVEEGKIVQANLLWDILEFIQNAGFQPLATSLGAEKMWQGPCNGGGLLLSDADASVSAQSLEQTLAMHKTLFDFDQQTPTRNGLMNMDQRLHWHPKMMWYGPAGIGTTRALCGFVDQHQLPFRQAFRRPQGTAEEIKALRDKYNAHHYVRVGDGNFSLTGGWPSFPALHYGGSFMGVPGTNKMITMRVMDFYHHDEGLIRENWVPIDVLDFLMQIGVDVIDRMQGEFQRMKHKVAS